jgi:hypothetical protein
MKSAQKKLSSFLLSFFFQEKRNFCFIKEKEKMLEKFCNYDLLVHNDIYSSKVGRTNILFLGGCRSYIYAIFFEELCNHMEEFKNLDFGFSAIGVHVVELNHRLKTPNLKSVIENADYIVCEQIRNYSILNTSPKCEQNIFNSFQIKDTCKIIQLPNMVLRYYKNDLLPHEQSAGLYEIGLIKQKNLTDFLNHCKKYGFCKLAKYVESNINNKRLLCDFNHPYNNLILELFNEFIEKTFNLEIPENIINILKTIHIFETGTNYTRITDTDYKLGITFISF